MSELTMRMGLVGALCLLAASGASAQERDLDAKAAKARAIAFLTEGPDAPRPDLRPAELERLEAIEVRARGGRGASWDVTLRPGGRLAVMVSMDRRGEVFYFLQPEREAVVAFHDDARRRRPQAEIDDEIDARSVLDQATTARRARAFLGHLVPGAAGGRRRFEQVSHRTRRDGLLVDQLTFVEVAGDGVLACFPNLVTIDVNPESGDVVAGRWTAFTHEVREAPPVAAAAALKAARDLLETKAEPLKAPRLVVLRDEAGPAVLWVVGFPGPAADEPIVVTVGASDGKARKAE